MLPPLLVLTDGRATRGRALIDVVAAAVDGGARAVVLREKHLLREDRVALADGIRSMLEAVDGMLVVAGDATIPAHGVHLAAADPVPDPAPTLLGRSCHAPGEVTIAAGQGCNYAMLSPVFPSLSKPGYGPPLGCRALSDLALPTWALGGVDATTAASCLEAGAAGVAVMGAVMRSSDPAAVVAELLSEVGT